MKKRTTYIVVIACLSVVILFALGSSIYRVEEGETALLLTFGSVSGKKGAGLHYKIPIIQEVITVKTSRISTLELGFGTIGGKTNTEYTENNYVVYEDQGIMLTNDNNMVMVEAILQYNVDDIESYIFNMSDPEETLRFAFETVTRKNVQNKNLDSALLEKEEIEIEVRQDLQEICKRYKLGVNIRDVRIQNITVPNEVAAAYEDVNNAQNEKIQKTDEAAKYENEVLPVARSKAYSILQEAEAFKVETIANAKADVEEFNQIYEKYSLSRTITRKRMKIEALENILKNAKSKIILGDDGTLQLLPLTEMQ